MSSTNEATPLVLVEAGETNIEEMSRSTKLSTFRKNGTFMMVTVILFACIGLFALYGMQEHENYLLAFKQDFQQALSEAFEERDEDKSRVLTSLADNLMESDLEHRNLGAVLAAIKFKRDGQKMWPPSICWREQYKRNRPRDSCKEGYTDAIGKTCRQNCPQDYTTCGVRPNRGLACGQSKAECRKAKKDMVGSVFNAAIDIAELVGTVGLTKVLTQLAKLEAIANEVFVWVQQIKAFTKTVKYQGWKKDVISRGIVDAASEKSDNFANLVAGVETIIALDKTIKALKGVPGMKQARRKAIRELIKTVSKQMGIDFLMSLSDPTGLSDVAKSFSYPKCHNEKYFWFSLTDTDTTVEKDSASDDDSPKPAGHEYSSSEGMDVSDDKHMKDEDDDKPQMIQLA